MKLQTVQIVRQGEATPYWFKFNPLYLSHLRLIQTAFVQICGHAGFRCRTGLAVAGGRNGCDRELAACGIYSIGGRLKNGKRGFRRPARFYLTGQSK